MRATASWAAGAITPKPASAPARNANTSAMVGTPRERNSTAPELQIEIVYPYGQHSRLRSSPAPRAACGSAPRVSTRRSRTSRRDRRRASAAGRWVWSRSGGVAEAVEQGVQAELVSRVGIEPGELVCAAAEDRERAGVERVESPASCGVRGVDGEPGRLGERIAARVAGDGSVDGERLAAQRTRRRRAPRRAARRAAATPVCRAAAARRGETLTAAPWRSCAACLAKRRQSSRQSPVGWSWRSGASSRSAIARSSSSRPAR